MSRRRFTTGGNRQPLSLQRIAASAIALADEHGLEALSMRKLADRLGVEAMSLYHHVPSKAALLEAMADELLRAVPEIHTEAGWSACLRSAAKAWRTLAQAHPGVFPLLATRSQATPALLDRLDRFLTALADAGFTPVASARALTSFFTALNGYLLAAGVPAFFREVPEPSLDSLSELTPETAAVLSTVPESAWDLSSDEAYEAHVSCLLEGLASLLRKAGSGGPVSEGSPRLRAKQAARPSR